MRSCSPTCCAPTSTRIDRCPRTVSSPRPCASWPAPNKTLCGTANRPATSSAHCCASTTQPLIAFHDLAQPVAIEVLQLAPTPTAAAKLTRAGIRAALRRAGRQRNLDATIDAVRSDLRGEHLRQLPRVEAAMGAHALALLRAMATALSNIDQLSAALAEAFDQHPDAVIITSMPGLGPVLGARLLGEIGDDRTRFADARGLKAFAGTAPVTRASGTKRAVTARVVRNKRLGQVGFLWAFSLLTASPGARAHYDRRREHGDRHAAACRNLANRYLGILHHCLQTGTTYNESAAFPPTDNEHAATSTAA